MSIRVSTSPNDAVFFVVLAKDPENFMDRISKQQERLTENTKKTTKKKENERLYSQLCTIHDAGYRYFSIHD